MTKVDTKGFFLKKINAHIELIEELGSGGLGSVFKAKLKKNEIEKVVAVKVSKNLDDPKMVNTILNEARIQSKLNHPSICQVFDAGTSPSGPYIVMEYLEGLSLRQFLYQTGKVSQNETLFIINSVFEALEFAHQNQFVHHDVSPHNIILTKFGQVKLIDFGLSKATDEATTSGDYIGKLKYLHPDVLEGQKYHFEHDYFSLILVLYELLVGHRLNREDKLLEIVSSMRRHDYSTSGDSDLDLLIKNSIECPQNIKYQLRDYLNKRRYDSTLAKRNLKEYLKSTDIGNSATVINREDAKSTNDITRQNNKILLKIISLLSIIAATIFIGLNLTSDHTRNSQHSFTLDFHYGNMSFDLSPLKSSVENTKKSMVFSKFACFYACEQYLRPYYKLALAGGLEGMNQNLLNNFQKNSLILKYRFDKDYKSYGCLREPICEKYQQVINIFSSNDLASHYDNSRILDIVNSTPLAKTKELSLDQLSTFYSKQGGFINGSIIENIIGDHDLFQTSYELLMSGIKKSQKGIFPLTTDLEYFDENSCGEVASILLVNMLLNNSVNFSKDTNIEFYIFPQDNTLFLTHMSGDEIEFKLTHGFHDVVFSKGICHVKKDIDGIATYHWIPKIPEIYTPKWYPLNSRGYKKYSYDKTLKKLFVGTGKMLFSVSGVPEDEFEYLMTHEDKEKVITQIIESYSPKK